MCSVTHYLCIYSVLIVHIHWRMAESITMMMLIQTPVLSERVPVLLTKLIVTDPSLSSTIAVATSNSMVTTGSITKQTKSKINM